MLEYIKIKCTDNDKWVEGKIIDQRDGWINVLIQPGDIRCNLKKTKPETYVGSVSGYEFVYKQ
jgi:hypothetical protein